jgi:hypothetical protein
MHGLNNLLRLVAYVSNVTTEQVLATLLTDACHSKYV